MLGSIEAIGTQRDSSEPAAMTLRIRVDAMNPATAIVVRISIANAMLLRREIAEFLDANNVSAR